MQTEQTRARPGRRRADLSIALPGPGQPPPPSPHIPPSHVTRGAEGPSRPKAFTLRPIDETSPACACVPFFTCVLSPFHTFSMRSVHFPYLLHAFSPFPPTFYMRPLPFPLPFTCVLSLFPYLSHTLSPVPLPFTCVLSIFPTFYIRFPYILVSHTFFPFPYLFHTFSPFHYLLHAYVLTSLPSTIFCIRSVPSLSLHTVYLCPNLLHTFSPFPYLIISLSQHCT